MMIEDVGARRLCGVERNKRITCRRWRGKVPFCFLLVTVTTALFPMVSGRHIDGNNELALYTFENVSYYKKLEFSTTADGSVWNVVKATGIGVRLLADDTLNSTEGHYVRMKGRGFAHLTLPIVSINSPFLCLEFWYYIQEGANLTLLLDQSAHPIWSWEDNDTQRGTNRTSWKNQTLDLNGYGTNKITFVGYKLKGSEVCLDDIKIYNSSCDNRHLEEGNDTLITQSTKNSPSSSTEVNSTNTNLYSNTQETVVLHKSATQHRNLGFFQSKTTNILESSSEMKSYFNTVKPSELQRPFVHSSDKGMVASETISVLHTLFSPSKEMFTTMVDSTSTQTFNGLQVSTIDQDLAGSDMQSRSHVSTVTVSSLVSPVYNSTQRPSSDSELDSSFVHTSLPTSDQASLITSLSVPDQISTTKLLPTSMENADSVIPSRTDLSSKATMLNTPNQIVTENWLSITDQTITSNLWSLVSEPTPAFQSFQKLDTLKSHATSLSQEKNFLTSQILPSFENTLLFISSARDKMETQIASELTAGQDAASDLSISLNIPTINTSHNSQTVIEGFEPSPFLSLEPLSSYVKKEQQGSLSIDMFQVFEPSPSDPSVTPTRKGQSVNMPTLLQPSEQTVLVKTTVLSSQSPELISASVNTASFHVTTPLYSYTDVTSHHVTGVMKPTPTLPNLHLGHISSSQRTNPLQNSLQELFSTKVFHQRVNSEPTVFLEDTKSKDTTMHENLHSSETDRMDIITTHLKDSPFVGLQETIVPANSSFSIYNLTETKSFSREMSSENQILTLWLSSQPGTEVKPVHKNIHSSTTQLDIKSSQSQVQIQPSQSQPDIVEPTATVGFSIIDYQTTQKIAVVVDKKDWAVPMVASLAVLLCVCLLVLAVVCLRCRDQERRSTLQEQNQDEERTSRNSLNYYRKKEHLKHMPLWSRSVSETCKNDTASPWRLDNTAHFSHVLSNVYRNELSPEKLRFQPSFHGHSSDDNGFHETIELDSLTSAEESSDGGLDLGDSHLSSQDYQISQNYPSIHRYEEVGETPRSNNESVQFRTETCLSGSKNTNQIPLSVQVSRLSPLPHPELDAVERKYSDRHSGLVGKYNRDKHFEGRENNHVEFLKVEGNFNEGGYESVRDYNAFKSEVDGSKKTGKECDGISSQSLRTKPKILKCVSFDEAHLYDSSDDCGQQQKGGEDSKKRNISTASETEIQYLTVPDSTFLNRSNVYETVNNLSEINGQQAARFHIGQEPDDDNSTHEQREFCPIAKEQPSLTDQVDTGYSKIESTEDKYRFLTPFHAKDRSQVLNYPSQVPESDFILPIIKKANTKILAERQKRKMRAKSARDLSAEDESSDPSCDDRYIAPEKRKEKNEKGRQACPLSSLGSQEHYSTLVNKNGLEKQAASSPVTQSGSTNIIHSSRIPKIILTTDDKVDEDLNIEGNSISPSPTARRRRIARENNPFLIEVDRPLRSSLEKVRRSSAPIMLYRDDDAPGLSSEKMTRSASGDQLVSKYAETSFSSIGTHPIKSWSAEFFDLVTRSESGDPSNEELLNQMINERYDALFNKKYRGLCSRPDIRSTPVNLSPRMVKRRSAQKLKNVANGNESNQPQKYIGVGNGSQNHTGFPPLDGRTSSLLSVKHTHTTENNFEKNDRTNKNEDVLDDGVVHPVSIVPLNFQYHSDDDSLDQKVSKGCGSRPYLTQGRDGLYCDQGTSKDELASEPLVTRDDYLTKSIPSQTPAPSSSTSAPQNLVNSDDYLIKSIPFQAETCKSLTSTPRLNRDDYLVKSIPSQIQSSYDVPKSSPSFIPTVVKNGHDVHNTYTPKTPLRGVNSLVTSQSKSDHQSFIDPTHNTQENISSMEHTECHSDSYLSPLDHDNSGTTVTSDSSSEPDDVISTSVDDDVGPRRRKDMNPFFLRGNDQYTTHVSIV